MKKPEKFREKPLFLRAVERAVDGYSRLREGGRWSEGELNEIAKSAAVDESLSYDGYQVDPAIAKAIRAIADPEVPKADGVKAFDAAWVSYSKYA